MKLKRTNLPIDTGSYSNTIQLFLNCEGVAGPDESES
jgi:hypothetical protein